MKLTTMKETAALLGITYDCLQCAVFRKKIAEPKMRAGAAKLFNEEEVEQARHYFAKMQERRLKGRAK